MNAWVRHLCLCAVSPSGVAVRSRWLLKDVPLESILPEDRGTDDGLCALLAGRLTDTGRARLTLRAALHGFDDAAL